MVSKSDPESSARGSATDAAEGGASPITLSMEDIAEAAHGAAPALMRVVTSHVLT